MKILLYVPQPNLSLESRSGYGTYLRELIRAFSSEGHEVVPFATGDQSANGDTATMAPGVAKRAIKSLTPKAVWRSLREFRLLGLDRHFERSLTEVIEREAPDLLLERSAYLQLSGARVASRFQLPYIIQMDAPFVHETRFLSGTSSLLSSRAHAVEREQLERANRVNVVSKTIRDYFVGMHGVSPDKFFVTHNGVDPAKLRVDDGRVREIKERYQLHDRFVTGFVGSFFRWHGIDLLLRAVAKLRDDSPQAKLLIVGDGEIAPELHRLSRDLQLGDQVVFTGSVPHEDVFNYIAAMDVAVLPNSHWYGSPIKIFEYGAMGKPVIAPDNGPVNEVMRNGREGLLVTPDVDSIVGAIRKLRDDPALRGTLAESFQSRVKSQHTWQQNAAMFLDVASQLVADRRAPAASK